MMNLTRIGGTVIVPDRALHLEQRLVSAQGGNIGIGLAAVADRAGDSFGGPHLPSPGKIGDVRAAVRRFYKGSGAFAFLGQRLQKSC
jgi:hypothetical protein